MFLNIGANVTRLISWLIMIPVAVLVVIFTIANRNAVTLDLWPTPISLDVPVFAIGLIGVFGGIIIGALITWLSGARRRGQFRKLVRQLEKARRDEASLRQRLDQLESSPSSSAPAPAKDTLAIEQSVNPRADAA